MKMGFQKRQKYFLNSRLLTLLIMVFFSQIGMKADDASASESESVEGPSAYDITYTYQLSSKGSVFNCEGSLSFSVSLPSDATHLILARTGKQYKDRNPPERIFFSIKDLYPSSTKEITLQNIRWATYFVLLVFFPNGESLSSPNYAVNDYIDEADLESLFGPLEGLTDASVESTRLYSLNKNLYIETAEPIHLSICDVYGTTIYNGNIAESTSIALEGLTCPIIIASYTTADKTITQKYLSNKSHLKATPKYR